MINSAYHDYQYIEIVKVLNVEKFDEKVVISALCSNNDTTTIELVNYQNGIVGFSMGVKEKARVLEVGEQISNFPFRSVEELESSILIHSNELVIEVMKDPFSFVIKGSDGKVILQDFPYDVDPVGARRMTPLGYSTNSDGSYVGSNLCFELPYNELFYGFGESFTSFSKRGLCVDVWNKDALGARTDEAYKNVPFFISSRGYGFFLNHSSASQFQMGSASTNSWQVHAKGAGIEFLVIPGENGKKILQKYSSITGFSPMPPLWSFGLWISNGFFNADRDAMLETAKKIRDLEIPTDVLHFDCYWLNDGMWCDFEWNYERFPEPTEMFEALHKEGFHASVWINPYVSKLSPAFVMGKERGYFLKDATGNPLIRNVWHGTQPECAILDFTNPEAVNWFKEKLTNLLDLGIDVFKTDFAEDIPPEAFYFDGSSGEEMHNLYSLLYNEIVFNLIKERFEEGLVWGRSGYTGSQKYPVCWSGDPATTFPAMAAVLRGGLSYGVSGVPFWSHDIGGFYGDPPTPELYVRWAQFGLFSSHSRCHGGTSRDPWLYGGEALKIFKKYADLRYSLLPYIVTQAKICTETGTPFIQPLWLDSFDNPTTMAIEDQYMFGNDILIAPILEARNERNIYLPPGTWHDFHTGEVHSGNCWIKYVAALDILPMFVKGNSVIPRLKKKIQSIKEIDWDKDIKFEIYGNNQTNDYEIFSPTAKQWVRLKVD